MRTAPAYLLALALAVTGCTLDPEDPLFVFSSLPDAVGAPEKGRLELLRSTTPLGGYGPDGPTLEELTYEPFSTLQAEPDGSVMGELTYFDTILLRDGRMQERGWKAVYAPRADLPPVEATFNFNGVDMDLPPLRQWDPALSLTQSGGHLDVRLSAPPRVVLPDNFLVRQRDRQDTYGLQLFGPDDENVWFFPADDQGTALSLPSVILEDFVVTSSVIARTQGPWLVPGTGFGGFSSVSSSLVVQQFPREPLVRAEGPITSRVRGQPCVLEPSDGSPAVTDPACTATDGKLIEDFSMGEAPSYLGSVTVALPAPAPLSWVVIRNLRVSTLKTVRIDVRAAADGQWHEVGALPGPPLWRTGGASPTPGPVFWEAGITGVVQLPTTAPVADAIRLSVGERYTEAELEEAGGFFMGPSLGRVTELSVF